MIGDRLLFGEQLGRTMPCTAFDPAGLRDIRRDFSAKIRHNQFLVKNRFINLLQIGQRECFRQQSEGGIWFFHAAAQFQKRIDDDLSMVKSKTVLWNLGFCGLIIQLVGIPDLHLRAICSAAVIGQDQRVFPVGRFQRYFKPFRVFVDGCFVVRDDRPIAACNDPAARISAESGKIAQQGKRRTLNAGFLFQLPECRFFNCFGTAAEAARKRKW